MTPCGQRFIHDLQLRNRSPRTIQTYVHHLKEFARFFKTSPDRLTPEHTRRYLLHVVHEKHASWSAYNQAVFALRFFYLVTCPSACRCHGFLRQASQAAHAGAFA